MRFCCQSSFGVRWRRLWRRRSGKKWLLDRLELLSVGKSRDKPCTWWLLPSFKEVYEWCGFFSLYLTLEKMSKSRWDKRQELGWVIVAGLAILWNGVWGITHKFEGSVGRGGITVHWDQNDFGRCQPRQKDGLKRRSFISTFQSTVSLTTLKSTLLMHFQSESSEWMDQESSLVSTH